MRSSPRGEWIETLAVGVFRCVFDRTMSRKSAAVGTGAMDFKPFVVDMASLSTTTTATKRGMCFGGCRPAGMNRQPKKLVDELISQRLTGLACRVCTGQVTSPVFPTSDHHQHQPFLFLQPNHCHGEQIVRRFDVFAYSST